MSDFVTSAVSEPTNECIRVPNVDEIKNITIPTVPIPPALDSPLTIIQNAISAGKQLDVVGRIDPTTDINVNVFNVIRKIVDIDGVDTPIGCAQILKTVTLHILVYDLGTQALPTPPVLITSFDSTLQFLERAGVCFPPEFTAANIIPHIRGAEAISLASFPVDGQFVFQISICQDLQVETEVKLEVLGAFCSPRDNNIDCGTGLVCDDVTFPKQCPNIYPVG